MSYESQQPGPTPTPPPVTVGQSSDRAAFSRREGGEVTVQGQRCRHLFRMGENRSAEGSDEGATHESTRSILSKHSPRCTLQCLPIPLGRTAMVCMHDAVRVGPHKTVGRRPFSFPSLNPGERWPAVFPCRVKYAVAASPTSTVHRSGRAVCSRREGGGETVKKGRFVEGC